MRNVQLDLLRRSIASSAHLLLRSFDSKVKGWGESERDDSLFNNYVVVWACYEAGLVNRPEVSSAVATLERKRRKGVWTYPQGRKTVQATSRALVAQLLGGLRDRESAGPSVEFIISRQADDGGWDEAGNVRSEVSGLGGTLPVALALQTFASLIAPTESISNSLARCINFLNSQLQIQLGNVEPTPNWLLKYSWTIRGLCTAGENIVGERAAELAVPMLDALGDPQSFIWNDDSYQVLYNVVHSLSLLGYTCDRAELDLAARWLYQRFAEVRSADIKGRGREVRHLAGFVLTSSKLFRASAGRGPDVGSLIPTDASGLATPVRSELAGPDLPQGTLGLLVAVSFLWKQISLQSRCSLVLAIVAVAGAIGGTAWQWSSWQNQEMSRQLVEVRSRFSGSLALQVLGANDEPLADLRVMLEPYVERPPSIRTNEEGEAKLSVDFLEDPQHKIRLRLKAFPKDSAESERPLNGPLASQPDLLQWRLR